MPFPIAIELHRSRLLSLLTVVLHAIAAACLWLLPWPLAARCSLLVIVTWSAWHALRPSTIIGLRLGERGELTLLSAAGDSLFVSVQADTTVFSQLVVLRVRDDDNDQRDQRRQRSLVLLPDSMPAEQFRLLRLWLRWLVNPGDQAAGGV